MIDFYYIPILAGFIIALSQFYKQILREADFHRPQNFHSKPTPRIGGLAIFISMILGLIIQNSQAIDVDIKEKIVLCALPVLTIGLTEDLVHSISIAKRFSLLVLSSLLATLFLKLEISKVNLPILDLALSIPFAREIFTVFAITGLINSYNIIDGFHGLSRMVGILTLLAIAYLGYLYADSTIIYLSLSMASAIFGFFVWNYPSGLIFLDDGGAYLIGFWIAVLSIITIQRHPEISPWAVILINFYPIVETLYSIYRRKVLKGRNPGKPDGIHFHSLLYRRVARPIDIKFLHITKNAMTSIYIWIFFLIYAFPVLLWPQSTQTLIIAFVLLLVIYLSLYISLVRFKTPFWLKR